MLQSSKTSHQQHLLLSGSWEVEIINSHSLLQQPPFPCDSRKAQYQLCLVPGCLEIQIEYLSPTLYATACRCFPSSPVPLSHKTSISTCKLAQWHHDPIVRQVFTSFSCIHEIQLLVHVPARLPARLPATCYKLMLHSVCWKPRLRPQKVSNPQPLSKTTACCLAVRSSLQHLWTLQTQAQMHPKQAIPTHHHHLCPYHLVPSPHLHRS